MYGDSSESAVGNGAIILTNPDPPQNLLEVVMMRQADSITVVWEEGDANGGADILDYRLSSD